MKLFRSIQRARGAAAAVGAALLLLTTSAHADFVNGGFEQSPDFTGWTTPGFAIPGGIPTFPPTQWSHLGLTTGTSQSAVQNGPGNAAATDGNLTWTNRVARVHEEFSNGDGNTASAIAQVLTVAAGDIEADGKVHIRFNAAPVLEDPGHAPDEQPYFFIEVTNQHGTSLYHTFNYANEPGVPWVLNSAGSHRYTNWQAFDIPVTAAVGDQLTLRLLAAGCGQGGHAGALYVNDVRTQAAVQGPSLWVSAAGPATICLNRGGTTNVTYTYTYRNNGTDPMYGVTASVSMPVTSDSTPVTTTFVSITNPTFGGGTCTAPASPGNPATCSIGTLQPGQQGTFQMTVQIPAGAIGPTLNNGTYSLSGATSAQGGTVVTQLGPLVRTAMSENCAVNVAPVPTLGEWAMMLLASLMAAFGWVMMRRRMG